jgi:hypothetical protein
VDITERFEKYNDEYLKFDNIKKKRSNRPDLHAFLLLDELFPSDRDIVAAAEHDMIWLNIECEQAETLTDKQVIDLIRCGVMADGEGLSMFA